MRRFERIYLRVDSDKIWCDKQDLHYMYGYKTIVFKHNYPLKYIPGIDFPVMEMSNLWK